MPTGQLSLRLGFLVYVSLTLASFRHAGQLPLERGISGWHDIVLCMIVFVFAGAGFNVRFAPEQNPPPKPQVGGGIGCLQCSASAPRQLYHIDRGTISNR